jgi:hypothetical protein
MATVTDNSDNEPLQELARELDRLKIAKDLSLRRLSKAVIKSGEPLSHTTIGLLLKGEALPRRDPVLALARVLGGDHDRFEEMWTAAMTKKLDTRQPPIAWRPEPSNIAILELQSLPEAETAREEVQEKIDAYRTREQEAHEEYYDTLEERAEVEELIKDLEAKRARLRVRLREKAELKAEIQSLEKDRARLAIRISELEVELSQTRATLLELSQEAHQIDQLRVQYIYEWARAEEFKAITLERRIRGEQD